MMKRKPTYEPRVIRLTPDEAKIGWTEQKLFEWMRLSHGTEYELRAELYRRAKDRERIAHAAISKFKKLEDPDLPENQERLAAIEREAAEAGADAAYAADRFVEADGVAA